MPDWNQVTRPHVLTALKEYDTLGAKEFLSRYGFRRTVAYTLWHEGQEYDAPAVLAVGHLHATGTPAAPADVLANANGVTTTLRDLGFDVVVDEKELVAAKPEKAKRAKAQRPRTSVDSTPAISVCPTCHMAVPASGVCDYCD